MPFNESYICQFLFDHTVAVFSKHFCITAISTYLIILALLTVIHHSVHIREFCATWTAFLALH